jgi:hypothetical protein
MVRGSQVRFQSTKNTLSSRNIFSTNNIARGMARKYVFNPPKIRFHPETSNYPPLPSVSKKRFSQRCAAAPPQSLFSFILPDPATHRPRMWLRPLAGKRLSRAPPGARLHLSARSIPCPSVSGQRPGQLRMSPRPAGQSPRVFCLAITTSCTPPLVAFPASCIGGGPLSPTTRGSTGEPRFTCILAVLRQLVSPLHKGLVLWPRMGS